MFVNKNLQNRTQAPFSIHDQSSPQSYLRQGPDPRPL